MKRNCKSFPKVPFSLEGIKIPAELEPFTYQFPKFKFMESEKDFMELKLQRVRTETLRHITALCEEMDISSYLSTEILLYNTKIRANVPSSTQSRDNPLCVLSPSMNSISCSMTCFQNPHCTPVWSVFPFVKGEEQQRIALPYAHIEQKIDCLFKGSNLNTPKVKIVDDHQLASSIGTTQHASPQNIIDSFIVIDCIKFPRPDFQKFYGRVKIMKKHDNDGDIDGDGGDNNMDVGRISYEPVSLGCPFLDVILNFDIHDNDVISWRENCTALWIPSTVRLRLKHLNYEPVESRICLEIGRQQHNSPYVSFRTNHSFTIDVRLKDLDSKKSLDSLIYFLFKHGIYPLPFQVKMSIDDVSTENESDQDIFSIKVYDLKIRCHQKLEHLDYDYYNPYQFLHFSNIISSRPFVLKLSQHDLTWIFKFQQFDTTEARGYLSISSSKNSQGEDHNNVISRIACSLLRYREHENMGTFVFDLNVTSLKSLEIFLKKLNLKLPNVMNMNKKESLFTLRKIGLTYDTFRSPYFSHFTSNFSRRFLEIDMTESRSSGIEFNIQNGDLFQLFGEHIFHENREVELWIPRKRNIESKAFVFRHQRTSKIFNLLGRQDIRYFYCMGKEEEEKFQCIKIFLTVGDYINDYSTLLEGITDVFDCDLFTTNNEIFTTDTTKSVEVSIIVTSIGKSRSFICVNIEGKDNECYFVYDVLWDCISLVRVIRQQVVQYFMPANPKMCLLNNIRKFEGAFKDVTIIVNGSY